MKNIKKLLSSLILMSALTPILTSCGSKDDVRVLRVFNCEDYIYLQDEEEGYLEEDMTILFENYWKETTGEEIKVVYDTYDTNETMLNSLKTGKSTYDLVCASDYTIQKMLANDMIIPFNRDNLVNYDEYCPTYLRDIFKGIKATNTNGEFNLDDYAVGYMWGTLGILYNPNFDTIVNRGITEDEVHEDMNKWNTLWDSKYKNTISIKDSMRDTYSVGVMKVFEDELYKLKERYEQGELNDSQYNAELSEIFNRCDKESVKKVQDALLELKQNIFGFEVDSGKEDINTGKIGINIAWSGDAVYSMDKGDAYGVELYYQIPETGGNIWFDGWCMPKYTVNGITNPNEDLAEAFADFMSDPYYASMNMDYTGYTSFIAGEDIIDLVRMWYDARADYLFVYDEENEDWAYDDEGNYIYSEDAILNNWDWDSEEVINMAIEDGAIEVDLTYMFGEEDGIFYTFEENRQFSTQYPEYSKIPSLAVMRDYGENNANILDMWEIVKTNNLPTWAYIVLIIEVVTGLFVIAYFGILKKVRKIRRINRRNELAK